MDGCQMVPGGYEQSLSSHRQQVWRGGGGVPAGVGMSGGLWEDGIISLWFVYTPAFTVS